MKIPLQKISDPAIASSGVNLYVLRLDLNHPHISGNKWCKLKYNIEEIKKQKIDTVLTFGGAYSNHIAATAAAGKEFGFKTIGVIRGDELGLTPNPSPKERGTKDVNPTLRFAMECGMKLHFVSREEYRKKDTPEFIESLQKQFVNFYLLPEGGTNELAVKGCSEILSLIDIPFDYVCCPVGTGGTLGGIVSSLKEKQQAIGFPVLKTSKVFKTFEIFPGTFEVFPGSWNLNTDYHFGGYAKHTPELLKFISDFEKQNNIPLDQVYTGKMMFGIYDLIRKGHFERNKTIVAIHTGGLQGKLRPTSS